MRTYVVILDTYIHSHTKYVHVLSRYGLVIIVMFYIYHRHGDSRCCNLNRAYWVGSDWSIL